METVSTWSQDVARGLTHPDSVAARKQRIMSAQQIEKDRRSQLNLALRLIRDSLSADSSEVVTLLQTISTTFAKYHGPTSFEHPVVIGLDDLADSIEEGDAA